MPVKAFKNQLILPALILSIFMAATTEAQFVPGRRSRSDDKSNGFKDNPRMLLAFRDVVATPSKSVVRVKANGKDAILGTIVDAKGFILTKASELAEDTPFTVALKDGRTFPATIVGVENRLDLAMLKIDATDLTPVTWGENRTAMVGELLASPGTGSDPVAVGVLSVAARSVRVRRTPLAPVSANSGFLGVSLEEAEGGARIIEVVGDSAAAKAGLRVHDIVTLIADTPIIDSETMINIIRRHKPGDVVPIKVRRGEQDLEFKATLGNRANDPQINRRDYQNHLGSDLSERRDDFPQILQHDMVLRPSDCGGPVVDLDGKALGINIARAGRVESYAIPAEAIRPILADLKSGKLAPKKEATTKPTTKPVTRPANTSSTTVPSK